MINYKNILLIVLVVILSISCSLITTSVVLSFASPEAAEVDEASKDDRETESPPIKDDDGDEEASRDEESENDEASSDKEYSISDIAELCGESVVSIMVKGEITEYSGSSKKTSQFESSGTGVILDDEGHIVTCQHVIDGAKEITVILEDSSEYDAEIIGEVEGFDMAVIKIDGDDLPYAAIGDSDCIELGEGVVVIGNPLGEFGGSVSAGILSGNEREVVIGGSPLRLLQTDAAVNPGNSGGGLFNMNGELIGMVNAKVSADGIEGIGFAIPINSIIDMINSLIDTGEVSDKVVLGISTKETTYRPDGSKDKINCLEVVSVKKNSNAEDGGIEKGDILISVNGKAMEDNDDLTIAIKYAKPGDVITVELYRDDELKTIDITLKS